MEIKAVAFGTFMFSAWRWLTNKTLLNGRLGGWLVTWRVVWRDI